MDIFHSIFTQATDLLQKIKMQNSKIRFHSHNWTPLLQTSSLHHSGALCTGASYMEDVLNLKLILFCSGLISFVHSSKWKRHFCHEWTFFPIKSHFSLLHSFCLCTPCWGDKQMFAHMLRGIEPSVKWGPWPETSGF